ncbi:unnamed protein product [Lactuca saligna]|uniref:Bulb-type lectin domain-containing protein n=1 Tax=Lactuca saligna TaxID=75948 RepID=A0AA35Z3M3_LACSI|nr:unnamed protein product [Lactuca saligna]
MSTLIIFTILCTNLIINSFPTTAVSTIKVGDQLNRNSQLLSHDKVFTLGFFNFPDANSTYLGIWETNDELSFTNKVWVANPSKPIIPSSSIVLMIHPDTGKLIIASGETTLVNISDNKFTPGDNLTATLSSTGNFKLKNETDNQTLWQSFDYPTNLLLPGMKIGVNIKTGQSWNLTSRLRIGNPDLGAFTLSWEPTDEASQRFMIRRRGQPYWTSGNLNNQISPNKFEFLTVDNGYPYNVSYVYNNDERYFTIHANLSVSFSDCMMRCWDDCSCLAINTQENGTNCVTWHGPKSTKFKINQADTSERKYVLESQHPSKATTHIWAPIVAGIGFFYFRSASDYCGILRREILDSKLRRDEEEMTNILLG